VDERSVSFVIQCKERSYEGITTNSAREELVHLTHQSAEDLTIGWLVSVVVERLQRQFDGHHRRGHGERSRYAMTSHIANCQQMPTFAGVHEAEKITRAFTRRDVNCGNV
jgi:hypothetical protein